MSKNIKSSAALSSSSWTEPITILFAPGQPRLMKLSLQYAQKNPDEGFPWIIASDDLENLDVLFSIQPGAILWIWEWRTMRFLLQCRIRGYKQIEGFSKICGWSTSKGASEVEFVIFADPETVCLSQLSEAKLPELIHELRSPQLGIDQSTRSPPPMLHQLSSAATNRLAARYHATSKSDMFDKLIKDPQWPGWVGVSTVLSQFDQVQSKPSKTTKSSEKHAAGASSGHQSNNHRPIRESDTKLQFFVPSKDLINSGDFGKIETMMIKKLAEIERDGPFKESADYFPMSPILVAQYHPDRLDDPIYRPFHEAFKGFEVADQTNRRQAERTAKKKYQEQKQLLATQNRKKSGKSGLSAAASSADSSASWSYASALAAVMNSVQMPASASVSSPPTSASSSASSASTLSSSSSSGYTKKEPISDEDDEDDGSNNDRMDQDYGDEHDDDAEDEDYSCGKRAAGRRRSKARQARSSTSQTKSK